MGEASTSYAPDEMVVRRRAHAYEGPTWSWPGTVCPFEAAYAQMRDFQEQRNMQLGHQVGVTVEVMAELEPATTES